MQCRRRLDKLRPPFKNKRVRGNKINAKQIADTGAEILITPCHNCHSGMEDIIDYYNVNMHTKFICEIMYEVMEKSETSTGSGLIQPGT